MTKIDETEQWLLDGVCSKCRRNEYCSKGCTKNKRRNQAELYSLVANKMNEVTGGAYGEIMSRVGNRY